MVRPAKSGRVGKGGRIGRRRPGPDHGRIVGHRRNDVGNGQRQAVTASRHPEPPPLDQRQVLADAVQPVDSDAARHQGVGRRPLVPQRKPVHRHREPRRRPAGQQDDQQLSGAESSGQLQGALSRARALPVRLRMADNKALEAPDRRDRLRGRDDATPSRRWHRLDERRRHRPGRLPGGDHDRHATGQGPLDGRVADSAGDEIPGVGGRDSGAHQGERVLAKRREGEAGANGSSAARTRPTGA